MKTGEKCGLGEEQPPVGFNVCIQSESLLDGPAAAPAFGLPSLGVFEAEEGVGESIDVPGTVNQDASAVMQEFGDFTDCGCDTWDLSCQSVQ